MHDILKMNRVAIIIFLTMLSIVIYDSLRTPAYIQNLKAQRYDLNRDTFDELYSPAPENIASHEAFLSQIQDDQETNIPILDLYNPDYAELRNGQRLMEVSATPPEKDYTEEQREAIRVYLKSNNQVLEQMYNRFPSHLYFAQKKSDRFWIYCLTYRKLPNLVAADGLNAILENDIKHLQKSMSALIKLADLYTSNVHQHYISEAADDNYYLARYTLQKIAFLVNSAMNRTVVPDELLFKWKEQFDNPVCLSSDRLIKALDFSNQKYFFSYAPDNEIDSVLSWHPARTSLELCGISTRFFKIVAPEITRNILKINKVSPERLLALHEEFEDIDYDRGWSPYELNYNANSDAIGNYLYMKTLVAYIRTGIALYLYGQAHGEFPETLEVLIPKYLNTIPKNPHDKDKRLQYKQEVDRVSIFFDQEATPFTLLKKILNKTTEQL